MTETGFITRSASAVAGRRGIAEFERGYRGDRPAFHVTFAPMVSEIGWLQLIRDHVMASFHLERDDLEAPPFGQGGLGKMHQLFGHQMDALIDELNRELVA